MGHSQSYDLRNPEFEDGKKSGDTVRGVRRISKEHETYATFYDNDQREEELRERIRSEQLKQRELELETLRIRQKENREPIIDAFKEDVNDLQQPQHFENFREFNHYDSLKHHKPLDPELFLKLHRRSEVNNGEFIMLENAPSENIYSSIRSQQPTAVKPSILRTTPNGYPHRSEEFKGRLSPLRRHPEVGKVDFKREYESGLEDEEAYEIPARNYPEYGQENYIINETKHQELPQKREIAITREYLPYHREDYPKPHKFNGILEPLALHPEVENHPIPRYVPSMSEKHAHYDTVPDEPEVYERVRVKSISISSGFTTISEIHAEKRMVVGVDNFETVVTTANTIDFPTYVVERNEEKLRRQAEVAKVENFVRPQQTNYEERVQKKEVQKNECGIEHCTHVEIPDEQSTNFQNMSPDENKNHITSFAVNEAELDGVVDLAKEEDFSSILKSMNPNKKVLLEEKLYYNPYLPTLTLERRPVKGYYDKLP